MPEKLRVLFHCKDNPWWTDSGYSIGARYLIQGLWNDIDLAVFAPVGTRYKMQYYFPDLGFMGFERDYTLVLPDETEIMAGEPIPVYPGLTEGYGEDIVEEHFQNFHAEILWQVADAWALSRIPELAKQDRVRWVLQLPVDFMEPFPQYLLDRLKPAMRLVPWVQDGKERLEKAGLKNVADPIPFGINPEIWKPQDRSRNPSTMASFGFRYDTFNISIIAANQYQRKAWEQTIKAIKLFREKRPEVPIRLYLHTHLNVADGWDMTALITHYGLSDVTSTARPYEMAMGMYSEHQIMQAHALADVVMNPGLEGFGLSTIQAQACGTPVIGLNAAATKNLLEAGVLVPVYYEMLTQALINRVEPHALHIAQALEKIYETPRSAFSKGVDFVHSNFTWDIVNAKWRKLFEEVDAELEARCIKSRHYPPAPSEEASRLAAQGVELA